MLFSVRGPKLLKQTSYIQGVYWNEEMKTYEGCVKSMNTKIPKNSRNNEIDPKEKYVIFETYIYFST